ncbi:MAG: PilZ domain-containing protein [Bacteriovoracaceae bacterium]|nr:PilZ domain-containing protein [Bacteriovoracaceae bacterium]
MNLHKIDSPAKIETLLKSIQKNDSRIFMWKISNGQKESVELKLRAIRLARKELVVQAIGDNAKKILSGSEHLNFFVEDEVILFQGEIVRVEMDNTITVRLPAFLCMYDRRKFFRMKIHEKDSSMLLFEIAKGEARKKFVKKIFDISEGGFSIIVSEVEKNYFDKHQLITDITVNLMGAKFTCKGRVVGKIKPAELGKTEAPYQGYKIAVQFLNASKEDVEKIKKFIFQHISISV